MVVFFDIDGTIVDNATQIIPPSCVEAIRLLRENGHLPVVNTGRPYSHLDPRVRAMDFGGWVCSCGMEVILDGQYLRRDYPTEEQCREILALSSQCRMMFQAEGEGELYYDQHMTYTGNAAVETQRLAEKGIRVIPYQQVAHCRFAKFVTYDTPGCQREAFIQGVAPVYEAIVRGGTMLEFVKQGNSKAKGMETLLQALHISKEETFAIGDSENDLPMFDLAGTTVCLGDGVEELKKRADFVTDAVLSDGIFNALRHFRLI